MQNGSMDRAKQLCEAIASERDSNRFMELISELNHLLKKNEEALQQARAVNEVAE